MLIDEGMLTAILQIIAIDIILGGDNAIIIALACRNLPKRQKRLGILWGTAGAIILRCLLVFFASTLLTIPVAETDRRPFAAVDWHQATGR